MVRKDVLLRRAKHKKVFIPNFVHSSCLFKTQQKEIFFKLNLKFKKYFNRPVQSSEVEWWLGVYGFFFNTLLVLLKKSIFSLEFLSQHFRFMRIVSESQIQVVTSGMMIGGSNPAWERLYVMNEWMKEWMKCLFS